MFVDIFYNLLFLDYLTSFSGIVVSSFNVWFFSFCHADKSMINLVSFLVDVCTNRTATF